MAFGFGFALTAIAKAVGFSPLNLFASGAQGAWYDPSDYTTLFEDSAGTIPITSPLEKPVGLMLDKSKSGVGTNGAKRVNLLTYTEQFDNAAWGNEGTSITSNAVIAPDGTQTADFIYETASTFEHNRYYQFSSTANTTYCFSVALKKGVSNWVALYIFNQSTAKGVRFWYNLSTGQKGSTANIGSGLSDANYNILPDQNGFYRCSATATADTTTSAFRVYIGCARSDGGATTYAGDTSYGVYAWGADLRLASEATTLPLYQKITTDWPSTLPGNHATQSTTTSRPTLSARYNLLTKTEQFDDAAWVKGRLTVSTDQTIDPLGTKTAIRLTETTTTGDHNVYQLLDNQTSVRISVYAKSAERTAFSIRLYALSNQYFRTTFNLSAGTVTQNSNIGTTFSNVSSSIESVGDGWYKCLVTATRSSGSTYYAFDLNTSYTPIASATGGEGYTGDGNSGIYIWHPDLRVANDGVNLPSYQRVNTATDFAVDGFPAADVFDGVDDHEITAAGGGSTTAFFWCSSIRVGKVGAVQTLFSDTGTNTGYRVRINASNQLELAAGNNTAYTTATTSDTLALGQRAVLTAWHDGANLNVQINNGTVVQTAFVTATAGTAQITIGKDNNAASSFFMGRLYEKVYLKDTVVTAANIAATKTYCANKAKITL